jgi:serine/threonine-protein kinase
MQTPEELRPGRRFGRYQLLHKFASGGMADVYLARMSGEEGFERLVAVKVIHAHLIQQPEFVKMFIDEARLASRISHPNVALTLDLGRVAQTHYIAMEYVDGESLTSLLRKTRPPVAFAMRIAADAAAGLHAAHELRGPDGHSLGVVHRDVSPANIMIAYDGTVKVVDFGVARARGSLHTTSGEVKGKFGYMSPEQFSSPQMVDRRTDVFALGVVLYEMTTWTRLFKCETEAETVEKVLFRKVLPPSALVPDYPPALERIVMRALSRTATERQETAQELNEELEQAISALGGPVPSSALGKMMREVFAEHIVEKRAMVDRSLSGAALYPAVTAESPTSVSLRASVVTFGRRRRSAAVVTGATLLLVVALGLIFWGVGGPKTTPAKTSHRAATPDATLRRTQPDARLTMVTIGARAAPAGATITLDGTPMENPFELQRPAREGTAQLKISAPGHQTQSVDVPLARGGHWTVALIPSKPGKVPPKKRVVDRKKKLLENPYE